MKTAEEKIPVFVQKWHPQLTIHGSEILLPPLKAVEFAEDLLEIEEIIMGCDGWRYVDKDKAWIVQVLEVDLAIEDYVSWENMSSEKNYEIVHNFLANLPIEIDFISFQLNDPEITTRLIDGI